MNSAYKQPVLVVDDNAESADRLRCALEAQDYPVTVATDVEEAARGAVEARPHVVLARAAMQPTSGFDLCRTLKAEPDTRDIPVIFLVGEDDPIDRAHGLAIGGLDYLPLPFDEVELRARVATALRLKELTDELRNPTMRDPLTGLLNRAFFVEQFERECNRSRRYDTLFALVIVDVDAFRQINADSGIEAGDHVLTELATVLEEQTRESDLVARWGSNEFIVLLPEGNLPQAIGFAKKLRRAVIEHGFQHGEVELAPTVSIGVASRQNIGGRDPGDLLKLAHACLLNAKKAGGDCVYYFTCGEFNAVRQT